MIYMISMIICISLTLAYCIYFIPDIYECNAVLYYSERTSSEAENVSDRELMDDAA